MALHGTGRRGYQGSHVRLLPHIIIPPHAVALPTSRPAVIKAIATFGLSIVKPKIIKPEIAIT
jgi:hypothetical protein